MAKDVFSVPIFFIVFREVLEAAIVIAVLLSLVEQIILKSGVSHPSLSSQTHQGESGSSLGRPRTHESKKDSQEGPNAPQVHTSEPEDAQLMSENKRRLIHKMRIQVFAGAAAGFFIAVVIGAAFIAVWFTKVVDLFSSAEELWEGIFSLIASIIIFAMGLTMLRMDRAKEKWRVKLTDAFEGKAKNRVGSNGKWILFILPFITVLREGLEAVIFIGGVSLGQRATSIPLAAIIGLICGLLVGYIIHASSSRTKLSVFLVVSTSLLLLIGAGLFSKSVGAFERHKFNIKVGGDVAEAGNGPGSYDVVGNIWHLNCCNPENKKDALGWGIFAAIFGWSNNGSIGTVLSYIFYWVAAIVALVTMKHQEGRTKLFKNLARLKAQEA
ncbi:Iron permease FTR1 [Ceratobasidium theobromae]|uniref:Iron permease FTR1 n=1 Tax=Ceratobasidium theobromae TaxID=1582974 RepID=A0A5N5QWK0_9AGAM|nr:Iron permease FTR1 [Ceratobasidium theobromae]